MICTPCVSEPAAWNKYIYAGFEFYTVIQTICWGRRPSSNLRVSVEQKLEACRMIGVGAPYG